MVLLLPLLAAAEEFGFRHGISRRALHWSLQGWGVSSTKSSAIHLVLQDLWFRLQIRFMSRASESVTIVVIDDAFVDTTIVVASVGAVATLHVVNKDPGFQNPKLRSSCKVCFCLPLNALAETPDSCSSYAACLRSPAA